MRQFRVLRSAILGNGVTVCTVCTGDKFSTDSDAPWVDAAVAFGIMRPYTDEDAWADAEEDARADAAYDDYWDDMVDDT